MITQVLNRDFVLQQLEDVKFELQRPAAQRRGVTDKLPFDNAPEDLAAAANDLELAGKREENKSSGQEGYDDRTNVRRGQEPPPIDDTVFLSHDPIISILQSSLSEYFERRASDELTSDLPDVDGRRSDGIVAVADQSIANCPILPRGPDGRRVFDKFSETDPRWVASVFAMATRWFRNPHAFNARPADKVKIAPNARLILVGDWGTGLPRAVEVAKQMRKVIEEGRRAGIEQHVIHLGDVYYSGWEREYRKNFLACWPVHLGEENDRLRSWCLNGNHDMYSGGHAYFDFLLADPRFAWQQKSSYFSLHNDFWNILGLDTAHEDSGLRDPQAAWVAESLAGPPRRSMLLSHHQLFSAYEGPSEPLAKKLGGYLKQHPVDVWFWGHEHRCVFYKDYEGVRNARLIGHGGVPVYMTHSKNSEFKSPSVYEYREFIPGLFEKWAYFGFAVVDLNEAAATVRYIDEFGTNYKTEMLPNGPRDVVYVPDAPRRSPMPAAPSPTAPSPAAPSPAAPRPASPQPAAPDRRGTSHWLGGKSSDSRRSIEARMPEDEAPESFSLPAAGEPEAIAPAPASEELLQRTPHMDLPHEGAFQPDEKLRVVVYADEKAARPGEASAPIEITLPKELRKVDVSVWLVATPHFAVAEPAMQKMTIDRDTPRSTEAVFNVTVRRDATQTSSAALTAVFQYQGRPCGSVSRQVTIGQIAPEPEAPEAPPPSPPAPRLEINVSAPSADLIVMVTNPSRDERTFECQVRTPLLDEYREGRTMSWVLSKTTEDLVSNYFTAFTAANDSAGLRIANLVGAGAELFEAAPKVFQDAFWAIIDSGKRFKSISIVTEEPFVPWELMVPKRRRPDGGRQQLQPLGVEYAVGRWVCKDWCLSRNRVPLANSWIFAPNYLGPRPKPLANAPAEADFVRRNFNGEMIDPATFDSFEEAMNSGGRSLLHFVCHGSSQRTRAQAIYCEDATEFSSTTLDGGQAIPDACGTSKPFVFLNACEVGRTAPALIGVGGFAAKFIELGASCVIAPLWSVKDDVAHKVAEEFYNATRKNPERPFAEILAGIRARAYTKGEGEDTFAAYCFYGDPLAAQA